MSKTGPATEERAIGVDPVNSDVRGRRSGPQVLGIVVFVVACALGGAAVGLTLVSNQDCASGGDQHPSTGCSSSGFSPQALRVGDGASISSHSGVEIRAGAGTSFKGVAFLDFGATLLVIAGPRSANGDAWYEVRFGNPPRVGWAELSDLAPADAGRASPANTAAAYCVISVVSSVNGVTTKDRVNTLSSDPCYSHWNVTLGSGTNALGERCGVQIGGVYRSIGNGNIWNIVDWTESPAYGLIDAFLKDGRTLVLVCGTVTRNEPQVTLYPRDWS